MLLNQQHYYIVFNLVMLYSNLMSSNQISDTFRQLASESTAPKYQQVCETLLCMIDTGVLCPGDRVPTETSLTNSLPVSLGTVQKALNTLTERGILRRQQGSGTYVADRRFSLDDIWHFRFLDDDKSHILPLSAKVLDIKSTTESGPWASFLGKEKFYLHITREISVNSNFRVISQFYLSGKQFKDLLTCKTEDLEGNLLRDIIKERFGRLTDQIREQVAAQTFPDEICNWLGLPLHSIGLVCHILACSPSQDPLSFQILYVPANVPLLETREIKPAKT